jgi:hypothetical protein
MFEEIPRPRRGVARLTGRRYLLSPHGLGAGIALTLVVVGTSVLLAATVITVGLAGDGGASGTLNNHRNSPRDAASGSNGLISPASATEYALPASSGRSAAPGSDPGSSTASQAPGWFAGQAGSSFAAGGSATMPGSASRSAGSSRIWAQAAGSSSGPVGAPSASGTTDDEGNALVYVLGYSDPDVLYRYAAVRQDPDGQDNYTISGSMIYRAPLAPSATITSGSTLCPPSGSACTVEDLIAASVDGFYAEFAIDTDGVVRAVSEKDRDGPNSNGSTDSDAPAVTAQPSGGQGGEGDRSARRSVSPSPTSQGSAG